MPFRDMDAVVVRLLASCGEAGLALARHDWSATKVGSPKGWSPALLSALGVCLRSPVPAAVWWGDALEVIPNPPLSALLDEGETSELTGRPAKEVWSDDWERVEPALGRVRGGESAWVALPGWTAKGPSAGDTRQYPGFLLLPAGSDAEGEMGMLAVASRPLGGDESAAELTRLREALELLGEMIDIAAHELKSPLTTLQLQVEGIARAVDSAAERGLDPARLRRRTELLKRQVERLRSLSDRILDVTRLQSGRLPIQLERVNAETVARDVVDRLGPHIARADCAVEVETTGNLEGFWDRVRLEQVLTNLLTNAIKYGRGSPVSVCLTGQPSRVIIDIADRGPGLDIDDLSLLFEKYERHPLTARTTGVGLGLYICRGIVEALGGTITASRRGDGQGTTFHIELPKVPPRGDDVGEG